MTWLYVAILAAVGLLLFLAAAVPRRHELPATASPRCRELFARVLSQARRRHSEQALEYGLACKIVLRPLRLEDRERCLREWREIESRFAMNPARAVLDACRLCEELARLRGRERAAMETPARRIAFRGKRGKADLDELRAALLEYGALIDDLLVDGIRAA